MSVNNDSRLIKFKTGEVFQIGNCSIGEDGEYPQAWFEDHPDTKPTINLPFQDVDYESALAAIESQELKTIQPSLIKMVLHEFAKKVTITLDEDWVCDGIAIGEEGEDINITSLYTASLGYERWDGYSKPVNAQRPDEEAIIGSLLLLYRISRIPNSPMLTEILDKLSERFRAVHSKSPIFGLISARDHFSILDNDLNFRKLIASYDMFFMKFPKHPMAKLRIGTLSSRWRDCTAFKNVFETQHLLALQTVADYAAWVWEPAIQQDLERLCKHPFGLQGFDHGYFFYASDFGFVNKSMYSVPQNPAIHLFNQVIHCSFGLPRGTNARMVYPPNAPLVVKNGLYVAFALKTGKSWTVALGSQTIKNEIIRLKLDEPLPPKDSQQWKSYYEALDSLAEIHIPRWIGFIPGSSTEIHAFADASEKAYGTVIYLRTETGDGVNISFIAAKTRVAPVKQVSLPRLELCAAHLAAQLAHRIKTALDIGTSPVILWTDSTIALSWIKSHPSRWKTYIANRVSQIQTYLPGASWKYVPTKDNPADLASRGVSPIELKSHTLWWTGPCWLQKSQEHWPKQPESLEVHVEERTPPPSFTVLQTSTGEPELISRYSTLHRLIRVTAWCIRFMHRTLKKTRSEHLSLSSEELQEAQERIIKLVQSSYFQTEISSLRQKKQLPPSSPLSKLNPFLDTQEILRVGGRINHSLLSFHQKHPILLPKSSHLSELIIQDTHSRTIHGGLQLTLSVVRAKYWILGCRSLTKTIIHRCKVCIRYRGSVLYQQMGSLPKERVRPSRPFTYTGVDYAGPVAIKTHKGRNPKTTKGYICVFVCLSVKAVHLELVSDYTTDAFLAAYKRFVSRRGLCKTLFSDCGTNFTGAANEFKSLWQQFKQQNSTIQNFLTDQGTTWKFNPPSAPHFGGLWEAAVKSIKHHLRRTIGESILTYEELNTLLTQIEALVNSRPLSPINDDPTDLAVLTPRHFLVGTSLIAVPEPNLQSIPMSRLSRWQLVQRFRDAFWKMWSNDYLHHLQKRHKWRTPGRALCVGDLVLIKIETCPPGRWPLARVLQLHPGPDGVTRVVTLKTATSTLRRPVARLVLLHKEDDAEEKPSSAEEKPEVQPPINNHFDAEVASRGPAC